MTIDAIAWPRDRVAPPMTWKPPAGTRVISADDHLLEPEHLWEERLKGADKDRAPKLWRDETGMHFAVDGRLLDVPGLNSFVSEGRQGMGDRELRLLDMDAEGIDASIVYHGRTMALAAMADKELYVRCIDVYNEWLAEWSNSSGGRLYGVAILPKIYNPESSRDYLQKIKAWGFKTMQIPSAPRNAPYNASAMEPLWDAIEESGIPISFHIGAYLDFKGKGATGANLTKNLQPYRPLWALLAFSGILERHPEMKVVFTEGGGGWIPSALYDADKIYREYSTEMRPQLAQLPSYYWHRQCHATIIDDPYAIKLVDDIGADTLLWSVDYPHAEGVFGESNALIRSIFDQLGEDDAKKIVGGNAAKLWDI